MFGRVDIETNDVAQLVYERRVGRELEDPQAVRHQTVLPPDGAHRRKGQSDASGHGA